MKRLMQSLRFCSPILVVAPLLLFGFSGVCTAEVDENKSETADESKLPVLPEGDEENFDPSTVTSVPKPGGSKAFGGEGTRRLSPAPRTKQEILRVMVPGKSRVFGGGRRSTRGRAYINFEFGSAIIRGESYPLLEEWASAIQDPAWGGAPVLIEGHTDSIGSQGANYSLSQRRAASVSRALVERGVDPSIVQIRGYGENRPLVSNATNRGRAMNRRAEFVRDPNAGGGAPGMDGEEGYSEDIQY